MYQSPVLEKNSGSYTEDPSSYITLTTSPTPDSQVLSTGPYPELVLSYVDL